MKGSVCHMMGRSRDGRLNRGRASSLWDTHPVLVNRADPSQGKSAVSQCALSSIKCTYRLQINSRACTTLSLPSRSLQPGEGVTTSVQKKQTKAVYKRVWRRKVKPKRQQQVRGRIPPDTCCFPSSPVSCLPCPYSKSPSTMAILESHSLLSTLN